MSLRPFHCGLPFSVWMCLFVHAIYLLFLLHFRLPRRKKVSCVDLITNTTTATDCSSCDHVKYEILQLGDKNYMSTNAIYDISFLSFFFCWSSLLQEQVDTTMKNISIIFVSTKLQHSFMYLYIFVLVCFVLHTIYVFMSICFCRPYCISFISCN